MNKEKDAGHNHTRGDKLVYLYKEKKQCKEDDDFYFEFHVVVRSWCNDLHFPTDEQQRRYGSI